VIGDAVSTIFSGECPSAGDKVVNKGDIDAFRLYYSPDGRNWSAFVEEDYDGVSDRVYLEVPGGTTSEVALTWSEKATWTEYSLDVQLADGSWIAPCVDAGVLGRGVSYTFDGRCTAANRAVNLQAVRQLRICSAMNGNWGAARCGATAWDGKRPFVDIDVP
jgi:hypothetical protein